MHRLLLFNPEHDYALANGGKYYSPPASIRKLASEMQLLPFIWGDHKDYILKTDNKLVRTDSLASVDNFKEVLTNLSSIELWGWDSAVRHRLETLGVPEILLPDLKMINKVRQLSHRRISIECNKYMGSDCIPEEIFNIEDAEQFALINKGCYFKLPWSSGGRGVLATGDLNLCQIMEWVSGAIRKQGSVLAEKKINRKLDFASLWNIHKARVNFEGLSVSISDGRGKYKGNLYGSQDKMLRHINNVVGYFSTSLIEKQKEFIVHAIAPHYKGKLGIDMICDKSGKIFPCVEINLRRTMGHVAMDYETNKKNFNLSVKLPLINIDEING